MIRNFPERTEADPQMSCSNGLSRDVVLGQRTYKWPCLLALATVMLSGCAGSLRATCAPYEELKRRAVVKAAASKQAKVIWQDCYADQYQDQHCEADAKHGFRTAYVEAALGSPAAPPPIPVRPLISRHSLSHSYPDANAWYEGYHYGRAAALSRGVDRWRLAPLDPGLLCASASCPSHSGHDQTYRDPYDYSNAIDGDVFLEDVPVDDGTTIREDVIEHRFESPIPIQPAASTGKEPETNPLPELTNVFLRS